MQDLTLLRVNIVASVTIKRSDATSVVPLSRIKAVEVSTGAAVWALWSNVWQESVAAFEAASLVGAGKSFIVFDLVEPFNTKSAQGFL